MGAEHRFSWVCENCEHVNDTSHRYFEERSEACGDTEVDYSDSSRGYAGMNKLTENKPMMMVQDGILFDRGFLTFEELRARTWDPKTGGPCSEQETRFLLSMCRLVGREDETR